jgi:hypothetical protein
VGNPSVVAVVLQPPLHRWVVLRDQGGEATDAFAAGPVDEFGQQLGAQPAALPLVDDGDGNFGGFRVLRVPDVAGDAQAPAVDGIEGRQRLVIVVVDLGEVAQLGSGQLGSARQEPQPAGFDTQAAEAVGEQGRVTAPNWPYQHLRRIAQRHPPR